MEEDGTFQPISTMLPSSASRISSPAMYPLASHTPCSCTFFYQGKFPQDFLCSAWGCGAQRSWVHVPADIVTCLCVRGVFSSVRGLPAGASWAALVPTAMTFPESLSIHCSQWWAEQWWLVWTPNRRIWVTTLWWVHRTLQKVMKVSNLETGPMGIILASHPSLECSRCFGHFSLEPWGSFSKWMANNFNSYAIVLVFLRQVQSLFPPCAVFGALPTCGTLSYKFSIFRFWVSILFLMFSSKILKQQPVTWWL
jgi:hypothetical protein